MDREEARRKLDQEEARMALDDARRGIKQAWIAAAVSGGLTSLLAVIAIASTGGTILDGLVNGWALIDGVIYFALAYGIYRKSRACAVAILALHVFNQIMLRIDTGMSGGIALALVFAFFYVQGIRGTFAWHKLDSAEAVEEVSGVAL